MLYESASGYALLDIVEAEEIGALKAEVQASVTELARFSKIVKLKAFQVGARSVLLEYDFHLSVFELRASAARCMRVHNTCVCATRECVHLSYHIRLAQPFTSAENALQNINDISEGIVTSDLKAFLEANLPPGATAAVKPGKSPKFLLGVLEPKIGTSIQEALGGGFKNGYGYCC